MCINIVTSPACVFVPTYMQRVTNADSKRKKKDQNLLIACPAPESRTESQLSYSHTFSTRSILGVFVDGHVDCRVLDVGV
jgi:hypothetical protein